LRGALDLVAQSIRSCQGGGRSATPVEESIEIDLLHDSTHSAQLGPVPRDTHKYFPVPLSQIMLNEQVSMSMLEKFSDSLLQAFLAPRSPLGPFAVRATPRQLGYLAAKAFSEPGQTGISGSPW
jgi:hypothetical protein